MKIILHPHSSTFADAMGYMENVGEAQLSRHNNNKNKPQESAILHEHHL